MLLLNYTGGEKCIFMKIAEINESKNGRLENTFL